MNHGVYQSGPFLLQYETLGQGRPCLIIGSAVYYPRTFSDHLCRHLQMTHIDTRAFAKINAQVERSDCSLEEVLKDIEQIRSHLNIEKPIVVGHSGNAYFALEYAKKYPEQVSQLVLLNTGPDLGVNSQQAAEEHWQENADMLRKQQMQSNEKQALTLNPGETTAQDFIDFYVMNTPKIWFDYHFNARELWTDVSINMPVFEYFWGEIFTKIDIAKGIEKITMPVFLGLGDHDFIAAPYSSWQPWLKLFKNIQVKVFSNSGHTPQLECPEQFDKVLLDWLNGI